jgi:maleate isomerase
MVPGDRVRRLGMITPSSNSVLEPTTIAVTAGLYPRVSTHFTRIEVKTISLETHSLAHFETRNFVRAACLLADAGMDVIAWNGTAGAWQGFAADEAVCRAITQATGVPATTSTLAQLEVFEHYRISRYALAVPYLSTVRDAIVRTFRSRNLVCTGSATLEISTNAAFADVPSTTIRELVARADSPEAEAIAIICTNLAAGWLVADLEQRHGKPVFDSTLVTIWHALRLAGIDDALDGWGDLLRRQLARRPG